MRIPPVAALILSSVFPSLVSATGFDCAHINVDGYKYDLSELGGVHELYHVESSEKSTVNTTYVLNICNILKGASMRDGMKCGTSKNICGFRDIVFHDPPGRFIYPFPIVGLDHAGSGAKEAEITRLKEIDSNREGLSVKLTGGEYMEYGEEKAVPAYALIEFQCDLRRTGLESLKALGDERINEERTIESDSTLLAADEGENRSSSLQFVSFGKSEDESYVLKLDWRTRYACDNYVRDNDGKSDSHWGFFTWFIIIVFLCTAAYLIFGSWLNYHRYGARGWDLLPHSDTIRDIPYILQDWVKRVINTLQGTGSRGGYSAV